MSEKIFKPVADVFALIHAGGEPYSWTQDAAVAAEWLRDNPKYSVQEFVSLERYQAAITDDLSALQQKLDAVVDVLAENVELKIAIMKSTRAVEHWNSWADDEDKISLHIETPATDAILNAVRAEGASMVSTRILACLDEFPERVADIVQECANIGDNTATELRADATKGGRDDKR